MKKIVGIILACVLVLVPLTAHAQEGIYPEDVFSSLEKCSQYFERCDQNTFEEIDGEIVMTVPLHPGIDWMYSKTSVNYDTYTISFDYALTTEAHSEANLLFAMAEDGNVFNQISFISTGGNLYVVHYQFTGAAWNHYEDDHFQIAAYEGDTWCNAIVELTSEGIDIYIDEEYVTTLSETPDYSNSHIGLRCGSAGGFKIKNFSVTEGVSGGTTTQEPTEAPTVEPTETPTVEPTAENTEATTAQATEETTEVPTGAPVSTEKTDLQDGDSSSLVLWLAITGIVTVAAIVTIIIILKRTKK